MGISLPSRPRCRIHSRVPGHFPTSPLHHSPGTRSPQPFRQELAAADEVLPPADQPVTPGAPNRNYQYLADTPVDPAADQSALPFGHTIPGMAAGATTPITAPECRGPRSRSGSARRCSAAATSRRSTTPRSCASRPSRPRAATASTADQPRRRSRRCRTPTRRSRRYHDRRRPVIGRFGLKARVATLDDFTADAFQGDMGMTTPMRPTELPNPDGLTDDQRPGVDLDQDHVDRVAFYLRRIAIPKRVGLTDARRRAVRAGPVRGVPRADAAHARGLSDRAARRHRRAGVHRPPAARHGRRARRRHDRRRRDLARVAHRAADRPAVLADVLSARRSRHVRRRTRSSRTTARRAPRPMRSSALSHADQQLLIASSKPCEEPYEEARLAARSSSRRVRRRDKSDAEYKADVVSRMHDSIAADLAESRSRRAAICRPPRRPARAGTRRPTPRRSPR